MFGNYVEVHEENVITNSMSLRMRPAMCMGPSGNIQGFIKFMCVNTWKKIVRRNYTRLSLCLTQLQERSKNKKRKKS